MDNSAKPTKNNPRLGANPLSVLFFGWLLPTLWKAFREGYGPKDRSKALPWDESGRIGDKLERNWEHAQQAARKLNKTPSFARTLIKTFWLAAFTNGLLQFVLTLLRSSIPLLLVLFVKHFDDDSTSTTHDACVMAGGIALGTLVCIFLTHHGDFRQLCTGMQIRIACTSLIYRKVHLLSRAASSNIATGQLVNLLSNDVGRYDFMLMYISFVWFLPIQTVLITYMIYTLVGYASFIGIAAIILQTLPFQYILASLTKKFRSKIAVKTDERIKLMNELLSGIQVIKMYAWEKPFARIVTAIRALEMRCIRNGLYLRGVYLMFWMVIEKITLYITLLACAFLGEEITAGNVFALALFYNALQLTISIFFPLGIANVSEARVSTKRIQEFLLLPEKGTEISNAAFINESYISEDTKTERDPAMISLRDVNASWTTEDATLRNISLELEPGTLCAVVGAVGSGKSSLLQLLIEELPTTDGKCIVHGDISYASQEPWLFNSSIRSNILFGLPYDRDRYNQVIQACALVRDFELFPSKDHTLVGERGASLSGGQRARINLARCVYREAEVYLLDDPLSAVDAPVGKHLVNECIGKTGYLQKKTRIIATHQLHILQKTDWIVVLNHGQIECQGTYADLMKNELNFSEFLNVDSGSHMQEEEYMSPVQRKLSARLRKRLTSTTSSIINPEEEEEDQELPEQEQEEQLSGSTKAAVYWQMFRAGAGPIWLFLMVLLIIASQVAATGTDFWVNIWTRQEALRHSHILDPTSDPPLLTTLECIYIYTGLLLIFLTLLPFRVEFFFKLCTRSSKKLHDQMFNTVLNTPMRFFDMNPTGRILNRFSKDMGINDELLPKCFSEFIQGGIIVAATLIMLVVINPIFLAPIFIVCLLYLTCIRIYLKSALDLRRTEGISRSPIYSHLTSSLTGIATIRSCNASKELIREFDNLQDVHTSCWYLSLATQCFLGLVLDCIAILLVTSVMYSFIIIQYLGTQPVLSGNVGFCTTSSLILTGLAPYVVRQLTDVFNSMTSVERILQYRALEIEVSPTLQPPPNWPSDGHIEFKNTNFSYSPTDAPILKDLTFEVSAGWKVGIVGRTGAGKSSLISAIFRLYSIDGEIVIDSVDTGTISLESLRSRISIIPQNPVLFSTTLRYNLDPFQQFEDAVLWKALEDVELKRAVKSLDFNVTAGGNNFSVGQRQLICLARAILRDTKVLLLDEATANVDPQTDALIQRTIRSTFKDCTVLTIAHRLNTVMDSDRILVMDAGRIKEYGTPYELLQIPNGALSSLVRGTGAANYEVLYKIAEETQNSRNLENSEK